MADDPGIGWFRAGWRFNPAGGRIAVPASHGSRAASLGASAALARTVSPLSLAEIQLLNRADVSAFDRGATFHESTRASQLSDATLAGNVALITVLTLGAKPLRQDVKTVAVLYLETLLLANGVERTVKAISQRPRPFVITPAHP